MTENLPFVSVVVPLYNNEATIRECLQSLLKQDYAKQRYEVIVVDNNSKDRSTEIINEFPVKYAEERKVRSSYAARNKGINHAKGNIIAFIDADCIADDEWLRKGVEAILGGGDIGCVAGKVSAYRPLTYVERYLYRKDIFAQKKEGSPEFPFPYAKTGNVFYKKEVFAKIGLFEERWISAGDADLSWRMQLETDFKIKFSDEAVVFHKHRSTLQTMFLQSMKYGIGFSLLCKKYRNKIPSRKPKEVLWVFFRLFYCFMSAVIFYFCNKENMPEEKRDVYLDLISFMGWEIGRIIGSVKNRVFAV